ncbi:MAG: tetratricopeptide repeat protein [Bacteroidales bacterium]
MRLTTSRDIPHVKIHDHKITVPPAEEELKSERVFKGMVSVNNLKTDSLTIARGYLLEYESYHADPNYLDSAFHYLSIARVTDSNYYFNAWINLYFLSGNYRSIINYVEKEGVKEILDKYLTTQDYSNYDGWTSYRIGQAFEGDGNLLIAKFFYENAVKLAPFNLEFQNKYGGLLVKSNKLEDALRVFEFILSEDPRYTQAYVNLGYTLMRMNNRPKAKELFETALSLNPDNLQALINLAGLMVLENDMKKARDLTNRAMIVEPDNQQVIMLMNKISE